MGIDFFMSFDEFILYYIVILLCCMMILFEVGWVGIEYILLFLRL